MQQTTDKANQHFVPKFYFRNFSFESNRKEIGLFNIKKRFFKKNVGIKGQASKDYFYGKDGKIEEFLGRIEDIAAPIISDIISKKKLPQFGSKEHTELLFFFILLEERNPLHITLFKNIILHQFEYIERADSTFMSTENKAKLQAYTQNENLQKVIFRESMNIARLNLDLQFKILVNECNTPFITSDFPVVRYNQVMEKFKWDIGSYISNGWVGVQIIIPLSNKYSIIFFDSNIYKVGNKKETFVNVTKEDVDQINSLQILNCNQNLYFNENITKAYVDNLLNSIDLSKTANKIVFRESKNPEKPDEVLVLQSKNNMRCGLTVSKIKLHSVGHTFKPTNDLVQFRKKAYSTFVAIKQKEKERGRLL